jgi:drug/metabolite transporter (DMT)-like permease
MVVVSALGSALLYALASVLQQRAARAVPHDRSLRFSLLTALLARPLWVVGVLADVAGFLLQFYALDHGALVLVQPLLVSGLLFALPLGAVFSKEHLHRDDWVGAVLVVAGLSLFLVVAHPDPGRSEASTPAWVILGLTTLIPAFVCIWAAGDRPGLRKAAFFAAAAGILYGLTAGLTKGTAHELDIGIWHALASWKPYALLVLGIGGMVVAQSAFQAGPLGASLPILTVVDPVVSIIIGALAFDEGLEVDGIAPVLELLGLALMIAGVFQLARSPLVLHEEEEAEP